MSSNISEGMGQQPIGKIFLLQRHGQRNAVLSFKKGRRCPEPQVKQIWNHLGGVEMVDSCGMGHMDEPPGAIHRG
uniref:Uncharacterized protein n=1 Tax=Oryza nivara TaxID=4536 RepID=A0A0E0HRJ7_ORYNI